MTDPARRYRATLDQLAAGDVVHPVEDLKERSLSLVEKIGQIVEAPAADDPLEPLRPELEEVLAVALPLLEHGNEKGQRAVIGAAQGLANEAAILEHQPAGPLVALALHDFVWTITAFALTHDRLAAIAAVAGVVIPNDYGDAVGVFEASCVRHPDVFDRTAGRAYDNLLSWLLRAPLRDAVPLLRRDQELDAALAEAELIAALRFATAHRDRSYCHSKGTGVAERRLRARVRDEASERAIATLYSTSSADLPGTLNALYQRLAGPDRLVGSGPLFPESG